MRKIRSLQVVVLLIISGLIGYYFGTSSVKISWKNYKPSLAVVNREAPTTLNNVDFSTFWNVWQKLETNYYDKTKLDPVKMLNGAIEGMAQSLGDPYTIYLPPVANTNFKDGLAGQFSGIGAELGTKDKQIIVIAPLVGSPAEKAGIKAGDAILKVNGEATTDWTLPATVDKIRGPKGTSVTLTILHKDSEKPLDIKIVRDVITVKSVVGWVKDIKNIDGIKVSKDQKGKIAYVRLSQFGDSTINDWATTINKIFLQTQSEKDMKGLIVDLRNNPGGYLADAVFISSEFLKQGTPVVLQENSQGTRVTLSVTRKGLMYELPIIVLINKGSASASEIVSGALRDNKLNEKSRAILVGETSFGKGTIQQADDLGNGAGLHITIAKWLTPNGTWINGSGLKPDIEVKLDEKDPSHDLQLEKAVLELMK
ncbi:MAG: Carboxyl-terminal protease [Candidatus Levybacteria bacterium GW2011_GWA2_37_36]|nr:MAG: Carboxyl-terminal protease [Candidatus Levybacteria bacterium GW2011_GWA2_37_36]KKQ41874.1 MAG: Carboxyl-terminal protease [Candidatus Levybacteria bacterium GW2011_GWB1_37_8]